MDNTRRETPEDPKIKPNDSGESKNDNARVVVRTIIKRYRNLFVINATVVNSGERIASLNPPFHTFGVSWAVEEWGCRGKCSERECDQSSG